MEQQYLNLLKKILETGDDKKNTKALFGETLKFEINDGIIPIYTTRQIGWKMAFKEMFHFLKGEIYSDDLNKDKITIWNDNGYDGYEGKLSFEEWINSHNKINVHYTNATNWNGINQVKWALERLQKFNDPKAEVRDCIISYWNPETVYEMANKERVVLPSCHVMYQLLINKGKLNLILTMRSNDMFHGNPFNVAQYSMLLCLFADILNVPTGTLQINIGDAHIYKNHIPEVEKILKRNILPPPKLILNKKFNINDIINLSIDMFELKNYVYHEKIKVPMILTGKNYNRM